jgi:hypothetical protein
MALALLAIAGAQPATGQGLQVAAPASLDAAARRVQAVDLRPLDAALARSGLDRPPEIRVALVAEDDPFARRTPQWIVGSAHAPADVVIFPERVAAYPYESLETIVWHEVAHLALTARADGAELPRWFHEGVAVSVASGWDLGDQLRLIVATAGEPAMADVNRLFRSSARPETTRAYLLAAALLQDVQHRHGASAPGDIAAFVARGLPFADAFERRTGVTVGEAAIRAWQPYRRWTAWLPAITSPSTVWNVILALAFVAFGTRLYRKARRRRQWDEAEEGMTER